MGTKYNTTLPDFFIVEPKRFVGLRLVPALKPPGPG